MSEAVIGARTAAPHAPQAPLFRITGLTAAYDGRKVLEVEDLQIAEGQITVLVGENGSGKTTLLRLLNGLMAPAAGVIQFRGLSLSAEGLRAVRDQSVLVHQAPLLFRGSVGYNVALGLRARAGKGEPHRADTVRRCLRSVGLDGFERRRAGGISGGEKQRVALARALALAPSVLLLDEPTASVDPEGRPRIEELLREAARGGTTVIMASHDLQTGYRLCDRLLRLDAGRVVPVEENILRGVVESSDEQFTVFRAGSARIQAPARSGRFQVAVLAMDEVVLSREPLRSSARNQLEGSVVRVEARGGVLRVRVDCGAPIDALITRAAAAELGVVPGAPCVASFKASAVRLY